MLGRQSQAELEEEREMAEQEEARAAAEAERKRKLIAQMVADAEDGSYSSDEEESGDRPVCLRSSSAPSSHPPRSLVRYLPLSARFFVYLISVVLPSISVFLSSLAHTPIFVRNLFAIGPRTTVGAHGRSTAACGERRGRN